MTNVAVILTGHMRCWKQVFPHFKNVFIDQFHPDIFISTWSDEGWWRPHGQTGFNEQSPLLDVNDVKAHYNPIGMMVENFTDVEQAIVARASQFDNYLHNPKNVVSMLYKLHSGGAMLERFIGLTGKKYDFVFRMRPDIIFPNGIPNFSNAEFITLDHRNHLNQGTGDNFQAGNVGDILAYSRLICHLNDVYKVAQTLCPHVIVQEWIKLLQLNWKSININREIIHSPFGSYVPSVGNTVLDLRTEEQNKVY